jgi:hypothetical protein
VPGPVETRLRDGAKLLAVELQATPHPLVEFAGMFQDDPDFQEVLQIMAENRKKMDEDPNIP